MASWIEPSALLSNPRWSEICRAEYLGVERLPYSNLLRNIFRENC